MMNVLHIEFDLLKVKDTVINMYTFDSYRKGPPNDFSKIMAYSSEYLKVKI
jgi:hypothetical protein